MRFNEANISSQTVPVGSSIWDAREDAGRPGYQEIAYSSDTRRLHGRALWRVAALARELRRDRARQQRQAYGWAPKVNKRVKSTSLLLFKRRSSFNRPT